MRVATTSTRRQGSRRKLVGIAVVVAAGLQFAVVTTADALPPPPPNPGNATINAAQAQADAKAGQVGRITSQLSDTQAALQNLQDQLELERENANKALVDVQTAQDVAARATTAAAAAEVSSAAAGRAVDQLRVRVDQFAAGSYEQGSALGSVSAYFGARNPKDLLLRQELLNDISGSQLSVLDQMQEARVQKANADSQARAALVAAQQKQAAAEAAKQRADAAIATAEAAAQAEQAQAGQLQASQAGLQQQLSAAQATVAGLRAQRTQYLRWLAEKQAEATAAAGRATGASSGHRHHTPVSTASGASVSTVIRRALSAVGIIYAWGGGDEYGPTRGIHDGGVADSYGDYDKIGFDCSGLMVYAFAGVGVHLAHYTGYQYPAGQHVPISDIRPGDMLFYTSNGSESGIHHVTLYIGGGMMVEAYESGMPVRVTTVRYGGLMPYATRML